MFDIFVVNVKKESLSFKGIYLDSKLQKIMAVFNHSTSTVNSNLSPQEAARLKARGVAIISVGVAAAITAEVTSLASHNDYSLTAADFDELEGREAEESKLICEGECWGKRKASCM